jgi:hypothetical protein
VAISAAVISQRIKGAIALIGNPLPIHDNPVRVAEEIAMLDLISGGRIISGFVRGTGIEQLSTNANPAYNREWALRVSADVAAPHGRQNGGERRFFPGTEGNPERDRLSAGGEWIRTFNSAPDRQPFFPRGALSAVSGAVSSEQLSAWAKSRDVGRPFDGRYSPPKQAALPGRRCRRVSASRSRNLESISLQRRVL